MREDDPDYLPHAFSMPTDEEINGVIHAEREKRPTATDGELILAVMRHYGGKCNPDRVRRLLGPQSP